MNSTKSRQSSLRIQRFRSNKKERFTLKTADKKANADFIIDGLPIIRSLLICDQSVKKDMITSYLNT
jgi:hypothetical protein